MTTKPKFTLSQRLLLAVVPRVVWALLWIVGLTWRFEEIAVEGVTPIVNGRGAGPRIFCFWHQCVLPCAIYYRPSHAVILISRSFDGELITRILLQFGFGAVRGSSSRGAREGLLGLKGVIESGNAAIFTADGPRGPSAVRIAVFPLSITCFSPSNPSRAPRELDPRTASNPNSLRMRVINSPSKLRLIRITAWEGR